MPDIQDPWRGLNQATNALFAVANNEQQNRALSQRDRSLSSEEERNRIIDEKWQGEKALIPIKHMQAKIEVGRQMLQGLPRNSYRAFHSWLVNEPTDKKNGYGKIPDYLLLNPDDVDKIDDQTWESKVKPALLMSADEAAKKPARDFALQIEESKAKRAAEEDARRAAESQTRHGFTMEELGRRKEIAGVEAQTAGIKAQSALDAAKYVAEETKGKIELAKRGGSDKANIIQTPEGSYTLGEIRGLWKDMNRLPDEVDLQIMKAQNPEQYVKTLKKMEDAEAQFPVFLEKVRRGGLPRPGQQAGQASPAGGQQVMVWDPKSRKLIPEQNVAGAP